MRPLKWVFDKLRPSPDEEKLKKELEEERKLSISAINLVSQQDDVIRGLNLALADAQIKSEETRHNGLVTIAALVLYCGGSVTVPKEIVDLITSQEMFVDVKNLEDGSILITVEEGNGLEDK